MSTSTSTSSSTCLSVPEFLGRSVVLPPGQQTMTTEDNSLQRPLFLDLCFIEISNPSGATFMLKLQPSLSLAHTATSHLDGVNFSGDIPENVFMRVFDTDLNWTPPQFHGSNDFLMFAVEAPGGKLFSGFL